MSLPLPLRNRLAGLIVEALRDADARRGLLAVAEITDDGVAPQGADQSAGFPAELFERRAGGLVLEPGLRRHASALAGRARRARAALGERPLSRAAAPLRRALEDAGVLFDAGLFFEAHELLEPYWMEAEGDTREALQGLIQIAVGFQHLAHANLVGAASLLRDGAAKLAGRRLPAGDLAAFARAVAGCLGEVLDLGEEAARRFDWSRVPRFPIRDE